MAHTFNPALPTLKDEARQTLGLTDVSSAEIAVFADETIQARLDKYGPSEGMAKLCEELADFFDRQPVKVAQQLGATIEFLEGRSEGLRGLARRLRSGAETFGDPPRIESGVAAMIAQPAVDTSALRFGQ